MSRRTYVSGAVATALVLTLGGALFTGALGETASAAENQVAAATAGCGKAPTLASGTRTISSGGQNRTYILKIPDGYDRNKQYKLIFAFHWLNGTASNVATGGSAGSVWAYYGQQQLSQGSAILVAPQGIDNGWANTGGRDLTLVDNLVSLIENDLCVDTSQLFATGWSYGGAMSYAVACARPTVFRAVAVLSGANLSGCSPGNQPVAYLGIHGTHDSVLNTSQGRSIRDTFVRNNGCTSQSPQEPPLNSFRHIVTNYSGCRAGYPVTWIAFDGDHTPEPVDGTGQTNGARTWTGGEIWKFFSALPSTNTPSSPPPSSPPPSSPPPSSPPPSSPPPSSPPPSSPPPSSPPPSSPPPSSPPPSSPPPSQGPAGCAAVYKVASEWPGGFQAEVVVSNTGSAAISGWRVSWTMAAGQTVTQVWNGSPTTSGSTVTVANAAYNGTVAPGASTTFGLLANGSPGSAPTLTCTRA